MAGRLARDEEKFTIFFSQIAAGTDGLFGLDRGGNVWRYFPATYERGKTRYAFWGRLTSQGRDATGKPLFSRERRR